MMNKVQQEVDFLYVNNKVYVLLVIIFKVVPERKIVN